MIFLVKYFQTIDFVHFDLFSLFGLVLAVFSLWMLIDSITHPIRDKYFWVIVIGVTSPIGSIVYALRRAKLLDTTTGQYINGGTGEEVAAPTNASTTSQVIKGVGAALGAILAVGGLMFVGFFVLILIAFSSAGSLSGGGGSEGGGK